MNRALFIVLMFCATAQGMTLREALTSPQLTCTLHGDGRSQLTVQIANRSATKATVDIPAGFIVAAPSGARLAIIRAVQLEVSAHQSAEAVVPAVPLSLRNGTQPEPYTATKDELPALRPLLDYSAKTNDLPRPTAQLATLLLLEDVSFAQWRTFLGRDPAPTDLATAIDALTLAQPWRPKPFALAQDAELRLLALRQPLVRAKAMQLFGMSAPEGVPVPDINQLLHTRPGDNCPICRMRAQAEKAGNGL